MPRRRNDSPSAEPKEAPRVPADKAASPEASPPKLAPPPKPQEPVDLRPRFTAKQMFRGSRDPIVSAFLHVEGLKRVDRDGKSKKVTRKLPREEWAAELEKFRTSARA